MIINDKVSHGLSVVDNDDFISPEIKKMSLTL